MVHNRKQVNAVTHPMTSIRTRVMVILKETVKFAAHFKSVHAMKNNEDADNDKICLVIFSINKKKLVTLVRESGSRSGF